MEETIKDVKKGVVSYYKKKSTQEGTIQEISIKMLQWNLHSRILTWGKM